jgi:hypothetical protein
MSGKLDPIAALAADARGERVVEIMKALENAGRGIYKMMQQLQTGVPKGDELYYAIVVQGNINEAAFGLYQLGQQDKPPEEQGPKLVTA